MKSIFATNSLKNGNFLMSKVSDGSTFDEKSIIQDLGLRILYMMAAREVIVEGGNVKAISMPDTSVQFS